MKTVIVKKKKKKVRFYDLGNGRRRWLVLGDTKLPTFFFNLIPSVS